MTRMRFLRPVMGGDHDHVGPNSTIRPGRSACRDGAGSTVAIETADIVGQVVSEELKCFKSGNPGVTVNVT
jgi:hypothetical protein